MIIFFTAKYYVILFIINLMAGLHKIDSKQLRNLFDKRKKHLVLQFNGSLKLRALVRLCNPA